MTSEEGRIEAVLVRNWGWLALRGVAALVFGVLTLFQPGITLTALVLVFGAYGFVDGVFTISWAVANRKGEPHWLTLLIGGILGIAVGVFTAFMPAVTALALLYLIAAWEIAIGVLEIVAAVRLRKQIKGEWLLALAGLLSVAFGAVLVVFPAAGALAIVLWIGAFATVSGALLLVLAFRLRSRRYAGRLVGEPRTA